MHGHIITHRKVIPADEGVGLNTFCFNLLREFPTVDSVTISVAQSDGSDQLRTYHRDFDDVEVTVKPS